MSAPSLSFKKESGKEPVRRYLDTIRELKQQIESLMDQVQARKQQLERARSAERKAAEQAEVDHHEAQDI